MSVNSNWNFPTPRSGLPGSWDKFVGPGATNTENAMSLVPATLAGIALLIYQANANLGWSPVQQIIAVFIAFDMFGGVTTNATSSAKRWYHRQGQTFFHHFNFVVIHILQIALVGGLFADWDWSFIAMVYGYLLLATSIVLVTPRRIQRSVALLLTCSAVMLQLYVLEPIPGFEWFVPVLFIKLLISHLVYEEPYV